VESLKTEPLLPRRSSVKRSLVLVLCKVSSANPREGVRSSREDLLSIAYIVTPVDKLLSSFAAPYRSVAGWCHPAAEILARSWRAVGIDIPTKR
jgi:hypothetical protein